MTGVGASTTISFGPHVVRLRFRDLRESTIRTGASGRSPPRTATTDQPQGGV